MAAFPADVMSIAIVTATQCAGLILMHEKMFESRMFFVDKLVGMGARIVLCDPHRALVAGPSELRGATVESPDIRAGMAMLIAALCAKGTSTINNVGQIERGYERIDERLERARRAHPARGVRRRVTAASSPDSLPLREKVDAFAAIGVEAFTTTRAAGDYGLGDGEPPAGALARWVALQAELAAVAPRLASARQVHGAKVLEHGGGAPGWTRHDGADGHLAFVRGVALVVTVADCVPVFVAHPSGAVALLHAGWRGTASRILGAGIARMADRGLDPADLKVHFGPAICGRCYQVGPRRVRAAHRMADDSQPERRPPRAAVRAGEGGRRAPALGESPLHQVRQRPILLASRRRCRDGRSQ